MKAGILLAAEELIAAFSIIQVESLEEAIERVKRAPNLPPDGEAEVGIRWVMGDEDVGDEFAPNPEITKMKVQ